MGEDGKEGRGTLCVREIEKRCYRYRIEQELKREVNDRTNDLIEVRIFYDLILALVYSLVFTYILPLLSVSFPST